jgi:cytochrome c oxidase subunit 2
MSSTPAWLLPAASDTAASVDKLFFALVTLTGLVTLVLFVLVLWLSIRYRKGSNVPRANPPIGNRVLEIGWIFTPLVIFIGIFAWAAAVYGSF